MCVCAVLWLTSIEGGGAVAFSARWQRVVALRPLRCACQKKERVQPLEAACVQMRALKCNMERSANDDAWNATRDIGPQSWPASGTRWRSSSGRVGRMPPRTAWLGSGWKFVSSALPRHSGDTKDRTTGTHVAAHSGTVQPFFELALSLFVVPPVGLNTRARRRCFSLFFTWHNHVFAVRFCLRLVGPRHVGDEKADAVKR